MYLYLCIIILFSRKQKVYRTKTKNREGLASTSCTVPEAQDTL